MSGIPVLFFNVSKEKEINNSFDKFSDTGIFKKTTRISPQRKLFIHIAHVSNLKQNLWENKNWH